MGLISFNGLFLLYGFIVLFAGGVFFSLAHIYHALRFGGRDPKAIGVSGVFIAGVIVLIWLSIFFLGNVDWSATQNLSVPAIQLQLPTSANLNF